MPLYSNPCRLPTSSILSVPVNVLTMGSAIQQVNDWIDTSNQTRLIVFANVHMIVEAQLRPHFREILTGVDLICPDGAPIYWLLRRRVKGHVAKVAGPEFMPQFCEQSAKFGHRHFLYGGGPGVAAKLASVLADVYPGIQIVGHYSPPFRPLSSLETGGIIESINASGADLVWVCLGCPRQEQWMWEVRDRLNAKALLAVGQAFDIVAGSTRRAPRIFITLGVEWIYRLSREPRRLWKRYLVTNSLFLLFILREKLARKNSWGAIRNRG